MKPATRLPAAVCACLMAVAAVGGARPVLAQPAVPQVMPVIDALEVNADAGLLSGSTVDFKLRGTPRGDARVRVAGSTIDVTLRESTPGIYAGTYTVRRTDRLDAEALIRASLAVNGQTTGSDFSFPPSFRAQQEAAASLPGPSPAVQAAPSTGVAPSLPIAGAATMGAAAASALTLQVTSPGPNAVVESSQVVVQGRTAPGALVHVRVDAVPPASPGRLSVARAISQQTVQADPDGVFSVTFGPQPAPPGSRLEVQLSATQGGQTTPEQRLVLYQRRG